MSIVSDALSAAVSHLFIAAGETATFRGESTTVVINRVATDPANRSQIQTAVPDGATLLISPDITAPMPGEVVAAGGHSFRLIDVTYTPQGWTCTASVKR